MVQDVVYGLQEVIVGHAPNDAPSETTIPAEYIIVNNQVANNITASNTTQQHMQQKMKTMIQTINMQLDQGGD